MKRWDAWRERLRICAQATTAIRKTTDALVDATRELEQATDVEAKEAVATIREAAQVLERAQKRLQRALEAKTLTPATRSMEAQS